MGFAASYLVKHGIREPLILHEPDPGLHITVTIPAYNESGLERCLDSLFQCRTGSTGFPFRVEVLILVNAPADATDQVRETNRQAIAGTQRWIREHPRSDLTFYLMADEQFPPGEAGPGLARKVLMDEAVRRFNTIDRPAGIIASLDADATVEPDYLIALAEHFDTPGTDGCSLYFEHDPVPATGEYPGESALRITEAITQYELHLRYYLHAIRFTGYPHAFHTVGSCFAVRADVYAAEGGMNRRKGGEDFYFIQKIALRGRFSDCTTTTVRLSPRPSGRVPFGTGPAVASLLASPGKPLLTYNPESFRILKRFFSQIDRYRSPGSAPEPGELPGLLAEFLESNRYSEALSGMRDHSASLPAFRKRFWRWFTQFRIIKFLHAAREKGYPDVPVGTAAFRLLEWLSTGNPENNVEKLTVEKPAGKALLEIYRSMDRGRPVTFSSDPP